MNTPFTVTDVEKAVKKLKNNKSAGIDQLKTEQLKKRTIQCVWGNCRYIYYHG